MLRERHEPRTQACCAVYQQFIKDFYYLDSSNSTYYTYVEYGRRLAQGTSYPYQTFSDNRRMSFKQTNLTMAISIVSNSYELLSSHVDMVQKATCELRKSCLAGLVGRARLQKVAT
jgi:hypothetical protein